MFRHEYPNRDRKDHRLRLLPERLGGVLFVFVIKKIGFEGKGIVRGLSVYFFGGIS